MKLVILTATALNLVIQVALGPQHRPDPEFVPRRPAVAEVALPVPVDLLVGLKRQVRGHARRLQAVG